MTDETRVPRVMTPPTLLLARALVALADDPAIVWYNLTVNQAVGHMMRTTGGQANPTMMREGFNQMLREAGLPVMRG